MQCRACVTYLSLVTVVDNFLIVLPVTRLLGTYTKKRLCMCNPQENCLELFYFFTSQNALYAFTLSGYVKITLFFEL